MNRDNKFQTRAAFTIWELLCIIVVILLLIGFLMPALNRVRKISTRLVCGTTLSGYSKAMLLYLNDNDDRFPDKENGWLYSQQSFTTEHPIGCRWHDMAMAPNGKIMTDNPQYKGLMWDYIIPDERNVCPQFRSVASSRGCENPDHLKKIRVVPQNSYTMNAYLGSDRPGGVMTSQEVRDPGKIFVFSEENSWSLKSGKSFFRSSKLERPLSTKALDDTMLTVSSTQQAQDCFATYHEPISRDYNLGGCNIAFIDSHVDSIRIEDQLENKETGWPEGTIGNLTYAWAAKTLPENNSEQDR